MNILDIIILICLVPAIIQGIRKGFVSQVISTASIFIGIWLASKYSIAVAGWLEGFITNASEQALKITGFALILVAACLVLLLVGKVLEGLVNLITLGWLGVAFAIVKCVLILGAISFLFEQLNTSFNLVSTEYIAQSSLYGTVKDVANTVFPYAKSLLTNAAVSE